MNKKERIFNILAYDFLASAMVWILMIVYRKTIYYGSLINDYEIYFPNFDYTSTIILFPLFCLLAHYISGYYLNTHKKTYGKTFLTTITISAIISLIVFFVLIIDDIVVTYTYYYHSLLLLFGTLSLITFLFRAILIYRINKNYKTKKWTINTIIIGTGVNAKKIAKEFESNLKRHSLIGFVSTDNNIKISNERILGNFLQINNIISTNDVEEVIIALDEPGELKLFGYINALYKYNVDIKFTPRLYEILTGSARIDAIGINPLVSITSLNMPDWQVSIKRFFDIIISTVALLLLTPFFLYFAIKIKRDSKGPVFYTQERIGLLGKTFKIIKFRTMYVGAENGTPKLSSAHDDRITPFGRILRKYRIDELPQFWNILVGEMSIVGPRPERRYYINQIIEEAPYYCLLYKIRPGLTSWGPIKIGYSDTIEKMIERLNYDIIYIENMSLLNDLKILVLTLEIIFKGKGV